MSVDSCDVAVADRVESPADGVAFPPPNGTFVRVDTGTERVRGWVVVDRLTPPSSSENWAVVGVVPVSADGDVWHGRVTPDQITLEASDAEPVWWPRVAPLMASLMAVRWAADLARTGQRNAEESKAELLAGHVRWRDELVSSAHQWADDNGLCSQFDDFMELHDLLRRSRMYDVVVDVVVRTQVTVTRSGTSGDDAEESVSVDEVAGAFRESYGVAHDVEIEVDDWTAVRSDEA